MLTGTVTLGIFGTASYYFVAEVIEAFRRRHPGVRVRLVGENSAQVVEDIRAGRIEAGMVVLPVDDEGLDVRPIGRDEVLYASARLRRVRAAGDDRARRVGAAGAGVRDARRARSDAAAAGRAGAGGGPLDRAGDRGGGPRDGRRHRRARPGRHGDQLRDRELAVVPARASASVSFAEPFHETFAIVTRRQTVLSPAVTALLRVAERRLAARQSED